MVEERRKKRKVSFYKPFIVAGIVVGILGAAPFTELMNFFYHWWGFMGGVMATYILSRRYPYFNPVQGAVLGFFAGAIALVIVLGASFTTSLLNLSYRDKIYPEYIRVKLIKRFESVQMPVVRGKILLNPKEKIEMIAEERGEKLSNWYLIHVLYTVAALALTSILGGLFGGAIFGKPAPKRRPVYMRKRTASQPPHTSRQQKQPTPQQEEPSSQENIEQSSSDEIDLEPPP